MNTEILQLLDEGIASEQERLIQNAKFSKSNEERESLNARVTALIDIRQSISNVLHKTSKPPTGLRPRWIVLEERIAEIDEAIGRYSAVGMEVPQEWLGERYIIQSELFKLRNPSIR